MFLYSDEFSTHNFPRINTNLRIISGMKVLPLSHRKLPTQKP